MNHLEAIEHFHKVDPILAQAIAEKVDCKVEWFIPNSNLLEALAWSIISQQISTKTANKIYQLPQLPSIKTVQVMGQTWKPYRTIASKYLWLSLSDSI